MSRAETIYPIRRGLEKQLEKIERDPFNREILTRYYKVRCTQVNPATVLIEFIRLVEMSRLLSKRYEETTKEDVENLVYGIDQKRLSDSTKNKYRKIIRCFFRWMKGCQRHEFPPEVSWITLKKLPLVTVTTDDLLPFDDCIRISEFARYPRDKALFQCKLDAGCRIGEILTVKIGEVRFNGGGAILYSDGKTGYQPIILTWAAKTLAMWLNMHPFRHDKDAPVFCLIDRSMPVQMSYDAARSAFKDCVKKAGYKRRVWLHLLKHVSSTEDASRGLSDSYRKFKHHWSPSSNMNSVYEHLSSSIVSDIQGETWRKYAGIEVAQSEQRKDIQLLKMCDKCHSDNPRDSIYCNSCSSPLAHEEKMDIESIIDKLRKDPEKLKKLLAMFA